MKKYFHAESKLLLSSRPSAGNYIREETDLPLPALHAC